jgi:thioredoxin 1
MTTTTIPTVTDATLGAELAPGSGLVAVEFNAAWCAPCRIMTPVIEAAARDYEGRLRIVQVDADANPATLTRLGVRGLPTMLLFRDGTMVDRIAGTVNAASLRARLDRAIAG